MLSNQPTDLSALSDADLFDLGVERNRALDEAKAAVSEYDLEVASRFSAHARAAFEGAGKEHGKVTAPLAGGNLSIEANISKKVEWDNDKLMAVAREMPFAQVEHLFKIVFSVPEKQYGGLLPGTDLKAKIDEARTVKYGEPKISLVAPAEAGK